VTIERSSRSACPVCDAPSSDFVGDRGDRRCASCGWPLSIAGDPDRSADLDLELARTGWARDLWQRSRQTLAIETRLETLVQRLETSVQANIETHSARPLDGDAIDGDTTDALPLDSDLGIDYAPLAWALSAGDWRSANDLTQSLIEDAIARNRPPEPARHALTLSRSRPDAAQILDDIARFPMTDLHTLAWLWAAYSDGRLGLVAQASQWTGDYAEFCDRVGWRTSRGWAYIKALQFAPESLDALPIGHLPVLAWRKRACYGVAGQTAASLMAAWLDRWAQVSGSSGSSGSSE